MKQHLQKWINTRCIQDNRTLIFFQNSCTVIQKKGNRNVVSNHKSVHIHTHILLQTYLRPKWYPLPFIVHYFWPEPIGPIMIWHIVLQQDTPFIPPFSVVMIVFRIWARCHFTDYRGIMNKSFRRWPACFLVVRAIHSLCWQRPISDGKEGPKPPTQHVCGQAKPTAAT